MIQCPNCGGNLVFDISSQQMMCDHCQTQFDPYTIEKAEDAEKDEFETNIFTCPQCGGEIYSTDNSAANFCSYCGASTILTQRLSKEKRPGYIIPFKITKEACKNAYQKRMKKAIFAPGELKDPKYIDSFRGIYMPFWSYSVDMDSDISIPAHNTSREGDYDVTTNYLITGHASSKYKGISHDASSTFDDNISESISPYDVKNMQVFSPSFLSGFYADTSDVDPHTYIDNAKEVAGIEDSYYYSSSVTMNDLVPDIPLANYFKQRNQVVGADSTMFPVWFMSYRKKDRVAYATINGQTGKIACDTPVEPKKYILGSLLIALPIFLLLNAFATLIPKTLLSLVAIIAMAINILFSYQISLIAKKESTNAISPNNDVKIGDEKVAVDASKDYSWILYLVMILFYSIPMVCAFIPSLTTNLASNAKIIGLGSTLIALVATLIGSTISSKKISKLKFKKGLNPGIFSIIALGVAFLVMLIQPAFDLFYYFSVLLILVASLYSLIKLIEYYNILATRPLPQMSMYKGGDDRA